LLEDYATSGVFGLFGLDINQFLQLEPTESAILIETALKINSEKEIIDRENYKKLGMKEHE